MNQIWKRSPLKPMRHNSSSTVWPQLSPIDPREADPRDHSRRDQLPNPTWGAFECLDLGSGEHRGQISTGSVRAYAGIGVGFNVSRVSVGDGCSSGGGPGLNTQLGLRY